MVDGEVEFLQPSEWWKLPAVRAPPPLNDGSAFGITSFSHVRTFIWSFTNTLRFLHIHPFSLAVTSNLTRKTNDYKFYHGPVVVYGRGQPLTSIPFNHHVVNPFFFVIKFQSFNLFFFGPPRWQSEASFILISNQEMSQIPSINQIMDWFQSGPHAELCDLWVNGGLTVEA